MNIIASKKVCEGGQEGYYPIRDGKNDWEKEAVQ